MSRALCSKSFGKCPYDPDQRSAQLNHANGYKAPSCKASSEGALKMPTNWVRISVKFRRGFSYQDASEEGGPMVAAAEMRCWWWCSAFKHHVWPKSTHRAVELSRGANLRSDVLLNIKSERLVKGGTFKQRELNEYQGWVFGEFRCPDICSQEQEEGVLLSISPLKFNSFTAWA